MTNKYAKTGFTLIELLVVVLIIGILASVALPQYQKAVRRARLSEVASTFNSISKGIDMYLLENGYSAGWVGFSGTSKTASLDIEQSCATEDSEKCYTNVGMWYYWCDSPNNCRISLNTSYYADGTTGNKWLDGKGLVFGKTGDSKWGLDAGVSDLSREICLWWKDMYGDKRVTQSYGEGISDACDAY